jgi:hypothetical protein
MDLRDHISVIAASIISLVKSNEEITLESLMRKYLKRYNLHSPNQFMDGLSFLYSINALIVENFKVKLIKNV